MTSQPVESFISVVAQHSNLGDLVIRRNATDWARAHSSRTHVLATGMPTAYLDAYAFSEDCVVHTSAPGFLKALAEKGWEGTSSLVFAPGPGRTPQNAKEFTRTLSNVSMARTARMRGGSAIALGRAARAGASSAGLRLERRFIRSLDAYFARDRITGEQLDLQTRTIPDVALSDTGFQGGQRDYLAMSFRYDHAPDPAILAPVLGFAADHGLRPILVTQVRMDNEVHATLAEALQIDHLDWPENGTHQEQLGRVQDIYRASRFVVTDRLHAALFATVQGALPAIHEGSGSTKARQTLSEYFPSIIASLDLVAEADLVGYAERFGTELESTRSRLNDGLADARELVTRAGR